MPSLRRTRPFALLATVLVVVGTCWSSTRTPADGAAARNTKFPQQILIIRHAEKTGEKTDPHLSKQGKQRAEMLSQLFTSTKERPEPFPTPDFIFAAARPQGQPAAGGDGEAAGPRAQAAHH